MKTSWHIFWPILEQCDLSTASPPPPRASIKCAANFKDLIRPGHNSIFMYLERYSSSISNDSEWNFLNGIFFGAAQLLIYNRFSRSCGSAANQIKRYNLRWCLMITIFFYFIHLGVTSLMNGIRDTISEIQHGNQRTNSASKMKSLTIQKTELDVRVGI